MSLLQKVVFIDGITRSGKSMVAPMFRSSKSFDPLIFSYDLEYVMAGLVSKELSADFARNFFVKVINERIYDAKLGRNFNFRTNEISSLDKMLHFNSLKERLEQGDGDEVLERVRGQDVITPFFTHDMALSYQDFLTLNLDICIIEVLRDPFEITNSWILKKWGERQLSDPRSFKHLISVDGNLVPWQARDYADIWSNSSTEDRCALVVADSTRKLLSQLRNNLGGSLLTVHYDSFATETNLEVTKIAKFLGVNPDSLDLECLIPERLPREIDPSEKNRKIGNLRAILSSSAFEQLMEAHIDFQSYVGG